MLAHAVPLGCVDFCYSFDSGPAQGTKSSGWFVFLASNFLHGKHQVIIIRSEQDIDNSFLCEVREWNIL